MICQNKQAKATTLWRVNKKRVRTAVLQAPV